MTGQDFCDGVAAVSAQSLSQCSVMETQPGVSPEQIKTNEQLTTL